MFSTYVANWSLSDSICLCFCLRAGVAWSNEERLPAFAVRLENQDILLLLLRYVDLGDE